MPTGTVQGTVKFKGQPLTAGAILFTAANGTDTASGSIQSDGSYTLRYGDGLSVPTGDYQVSITPSAANAPAPDPMELMKNPAKFAPPVAPYDAKYRDPKKSGLIAVVKEGSNTHDFDLKE